MSTFKKLVGIALVGAGVMACATEAETNAPAIADDDSLDTLTDGYSWNGWVLAAGWTYYPDQGYTDFYMGFNRSYGDATRGGGHCLVAYEGTTCSSDSTCISRAQTLYPASTYGLPSNDQAWGYCWQSHCYVRPGSGAELCYRNPANTPGYKSFPNANAFGILDARANYTMPRAILGCMTKTVGPNGACGGDNQDLYIRNVTSQQFVYGG